ncbi:MAG: hypothetical protein U1E53_16145 [Dongiaceae bacterium]
MRPRVVSTSLEEQIALMEGSEDRREKLARERSEDHIFQARLAARRPLVWDGPALSRYRRKD